MAWFRAILHRGRQVHLVSTLGDASQGTASDLTEEGRLIVAERTESLRLLERSRASPANPWIGTSLRFKAPPAAGKPIPMARACQDLRKAKQGEYGGKATKTWVSEAESPIHCEFEEPLLVDGWSSRQ